MYRFIFSLVLCLVFIALASHCSAYTLKPMYHDYRFYDSVEVRLLEFGTHGSTTRLPVIQGTIEYILKSDGLGNLVWTSIGAATAPNLNEVLDKGASSAIKPYLSGGISISGTSEVENIAITGIIDGDLIPANNLIHDLGSLTYYFKNLYIDHISSLTGITSTGTANFTQSITTGAHYYGDLSKATGYIETDTLNSVTDRGATTDQTITVVGIVSSGTVQAAGSITGGIFYGDGSQLTGITGEQSINDVLTTGNSSNIGMYLTGGLKINIVNVTDALVSPVFSVQGSGVSVTSDITSTGSAEFTCAVTASVFYGSAAGLTGIVSTSEVFITGTQETTYSGRYIDFVDFGVVRVGDTIEVRAAASGASIDESGIVHKDSTETIISMKTFLVSPIVPTPTTDFQTSTKKYVDDQNTTQTLDSITSSGNSTANDIYLTGGLRLSGEFISPVFHVDAIDTSITTDLTVYGTNTVVVEFSASGSAQITQSVTSDSIYGNIAVISNISADSVTSNYITVSEGGTIRTITTDKITATYLNADTIEANVVTAEIGYYVKENESITAPVSGYGGYYMKNGKPYFVTDTAEYMLAQPADGSFENISASAIQTPGSVTAGAVYGGYIGTTGNISASGTITATGSVTGGVLYGGQIYSSGSVQATNSVTAGAIYGGYIASSGTAQVTGSITGGILYGGKIATTGTVSATQSITGGALYGGYIVSTGDIKATDDIYASGEVRVTSNLTAQGYVASNWLYVNGSANLMNSVTADSLYASTATISNINSDSLEVFYIQYKPITFESVPNNSIYLDSSRGVLCFRQGDRRYKISSIEVELP